MNRETEFVQIQELFDALLHLSDAAREDYLSSHPELPSEIVEQTVPLLQADRSKVSLPSLDSVWTPRSGDMRTR
jgi:hypothetical protein